MGCCKNSHSWFYIIQEEYFFSYDMNKVNRHCGKEMFKTLVRDKSYMKQYITGNMNVTLTFAFYIQILLSIVRTDYLCSLVHSEFNFPKNQINVNIATGFCFAF